MSQKKKKRSAAGRTTSGRPTPGRTALPKSPWNVRAAEGLLWVFVIVTPFLVVARAHENYRFPKLLLFEVLAIASLVLLTFSLRRLKTLEWRPLLVPALVCAPIPVVASLSYFWTDHPLHVARGLIPLWVGAAALFGWSVALGHQQKRRLLKGYVFVAMFAVVVVAVQTYRAYFVVEAFRASKRLASAGAIGGVADAATYFAIACLTAQWLAWTSQGRERKLWIGGALLCLVGLGLTQTLTGLGALVLGSLVFGWHVLPRRRLVAAVAVAVALGAILLIVSPAHQKRFERIGDAAREPGKFLDTVVNAGTTGRLDAWQAAFQMFKEHPLGGVGQGTFVAEFAPVKRTLIEDGVTFFKKHRPTQAHFDSAHNEFLEVAAELGLLGLLALTVTLVVLFRQLRRRWRHANKENVANEVFLQASVVALFFLSTNYFPMHLAIIAFPYLLILSWILEPERKADSTPEKNAEEPA